MSRMDLVVNGQAVDDGALVFFAAVPYGLLRPIFQALGGMVTWQSRENQAVVTWQNNLMVVPATGHSILLNGQTRTFTEAHRIVDGRLCVSLADLAAVFLGTLRQEEDRLYLFMPSSLLTGVAMSKDSLVFHWAGSAKLSGSGEDAVGGLALTGSSWAMPLRRLTIEQSPRGHLLIKIDSGGRQLDFHAGEQGLRVTWQGPPQELGGLIVALDAGHGGQQPGAVGTTGVLEKELARQVVDLLTLRLRAAGARVLDVRPGDETVSLAERVNRSRSGKAEIFVSVHYNAHEKSSANGIETFHAADNAEAGQLARLVQGELVGALNLRDRGVKQAAFHVLRAQGEIPAVLTEIGFLTNPVEEQFLLKQSTMPLKAEALYRAILRYVTLRGKL